jgi:hypothetical protein
MSQVSRSLAALVANIVVKFPLTTVSIAVPVGVRVGLSHESSRSMEDLSIGADESQHKRLLV